MRQVVGIILCIYLSGCSYIDYLEHSQGVKAPTPTEISSFAWETEVGTVIPDGTNRRLTAGEYLVASWAYTDQQCHNFFDLLERFKQDSSLLDKVLTAAIAASSPLPQSTLASVTTSIAFANQINQNTADIFAFATFKDQLMPQVFRLMSCYRQGNTSDCNQNNLQNHNWQEILNDYMQGKTSNVYKNFLNSSSRANLMIARNISQEYSSLCSLSSLRSIVAGALTATKTNLVSTSPVSTTTTAKNNN